MDRILYKEANGDLTCRARDFDKVFPTLYAYEETGMTPDQIVAMKGLHTARQDLIAENEKLKADHNFLLQKLREYAMCDACKHKDNLNAEEEGRLVLLPPCKIGDTIYITAYPPDEIEAEPEIWDGKVKKFCVYKNGVDVFYMYGPFMRGITVPASEFGKTWFLTREEAEAALAKDTNVPGKKED